MSYSRLIHRNGLTHWGYMAQPGDPVTLGEAGNAHPHWSADGVAALSCIGRGYLEGELRRMETDQINDADSYAKVAGTTPETAAAVLRAVFGVPEPDCADCNRRRGLAHGAEVDPGRCHVHEVYGRSPVPA
jgi:hypothetical protein